MSAVVRTVCTAYLLAFGARDAALFCIRRDGLESGEFIGGVVDCMLTGCRKLGWGFGVGGAESDGESTKNTQLTNHSQKITRSHNSSHDIFFTRSHINSQMTKNTQELNNKNLLLQGKCDRAYQNVHVHYKSYLNDIFRYPFFENFCENM